MKDYYRLGGDIFIASAFVTFIIGGLLKVFEMTGFAWILTAAGFMKLSAMCLFFSMALSLLDISQKTK